MIPTIIEEDGHKFAVFHDGIRERARIQVEWTRERGYTGVTGEGYGYDAHANLYRMAREQLLDRDDIRRVVDMPCGCGYGSDILSRAGWNVLGIDKDRKAIKFASLRAESAWFNCMDMCEPADDSDHLTDAVVSIEGFEHVPHESIGRLCRNYALTLRPGGILFLTTPDRRYSAGTNPFHEHEYVYEEIVALLDAAGFGEYTRLTAPTSPTIVMMAVRQ